MNLPFFLYILFLIATLFVLYKKQRKTPYLKIGWFFNLLTFAYYGLPILVIIFYADFQHELIENRNFSNNFLIKMSTILAVCQVGFLIAELFIKEKSFAKFSKNNYSPIKSRFIYILLLLTYISFFIRWSDVGGFFTIISQARYTYMNEVSSSVGLKGRYDILFYIVTSIVVYNIIIDRKYIVENKILLLSYGFFIILTILMGTRLLFLCFLIALFSGIFLFNIEFIKRHKKSIFLLTFILILSFSAFKSIYPYIGAYVTNKNINIDEIEISFIPTELLTGLLSHHSIEHGLTINEVSFFERIIPNKLLSMFGFDVATPFTQRIALESFYTSGRAVYTVPYLSAVYFSANKNLFIFSIFNIILYLLFNLIQKKLASKNLLYLILLYVLVYYVMRAEISVWFGRFYLSFFLLFLTIKLGGKRLFVESYH